MACQVDDVLICMRENSSSLGQSLASTNAIRAAGGKISGFVVTMMKTDSRSDVTSEAFSERQYVRAG